MIVSALFGFLSTLNCGDSFVIIGQIQCDYGTERNLEAQLNFKKIQLQLNSYGYFKLHVPDNQTISLNVFHPHCDYEPVVVKTFEQSYKRYIYLNGTSKSQEGWWKTPSIIIFFLLNVLVVFAFWFLWNLKHKVSVKREPDIEMNRPRKA